MMEKCPFKYEITYTNIGLKPTKETITKCKLIRHSENVYFDKCISEENCPIYNLKTENVVLDMKV